MIHIYENKKKTQQNKIIYSYTQVTTPVNTDFFFLYNKIKFFEMFVISCRHTVIPIYF